MLAVMLLPSPAAAQEFPTFSEGSCYNFRVSPGSTTAAWEGKTGSFQVTWDFRAPPNNGSICILPCITSDCVLEIGGVTSSDSWLSGTGNASYSGGVTSYSVSYTAAENPGGARSGTLSVAGATFTVSQAANPTLPPCPNSPTSVSPSATSFGPEGGEATVSVTGRSDCTWTVSDDRDWITTGSSSVAGEESVTITAKTNSGDARSGTVTIGGASVSVSQNANPIPCVYSALPTSVNVGAGASTGSLTVLAYRQNWPAIAGPAPDCPWTASK